MQAIAVTEHHRFYVRWWDAVKFAAERWKEIVGGGACISAGIVLWLLIGWSAGPGPGDATRNVDVGLQFGLLGSVVYIVGCWLPFKGGKDSFLDSLPLMGVMGLLGISGLALGIALPRELLYATLGKLFAGMMIWMMVTMTIAEWLDAQLSRLARPYIDRFTARYINTPKHLARIAERKAQRERRQRLKPFLSSEQRKIFQIQIVAGFILWLLVALSIISYWFAKGTDLHNWPISATALIVWWVVGTVCTGIAGRKSQRLYKEAERIEQAWLDAERESQQV